MKTYTRYTYKVKAAIILAASIGKLNPKEISRGGVHPPSLYETLEEEGYIWDTPQQQWRKRKYPNGKEYGIPNAHAAQKTSSLGKIRTVRILFRGDVDLIGRKADDMVALLELVGARVVWRGHPGNLNAKTNVATLSLHIEFLDEDGDRV